ncbi:MAG: hypothetical protein IJ745_02475 [Bacteroidales bacterium]|nr:hypothetical protein [Bacteroidales bacterium]
MEKKVLMGGKGSEKKVLSGKSKASSAAFRIFWYSFVILTGWGVGAGWHWGTILCLALGGVAIVVLDYMTSREVVPSAWAFLDEEGITLSGCARMENDSMRVDAGAVTLKWSDISAIEQRLIRMNTGEVYSDSAVYESGKISLKTMASPFGEKGWAEINRYYARYKEANKQ